MKIKVIFDRTPLNSIHSVLFLFVFILGLSGALFGFICMILHFLGFGILTDFVGLIVICTVIPFAIMLLYTWLTIKIKQRGKQNFMDQGKKDSKEILSVKRIKKNKLFF